MGQTNVNDPEQTLAQRTMNDGSAPIHVVPAAYNTPRNRTFAHALLLEWPDLLEWSDLRFARMPALIDIYSTRVICPDCELVGY